MAKRPPPSDQRREKKNKIHLSLFVDGQDVTLLEEFNTPEEAIAAARHFLDTHHPERPQTSPRKSTAKRTPSSRRPRKG
jgi:hypothetical protein